MLASRTRWVLVLGLWALTGCRHMIPAPYPRGQAPASSLLLERTGAQLQALQVSKAKVVANRTQRGNLAFLAEAPNRFRGTVDVAGNELVTLAFHEQGYALRYKLDAFPQGFYTGPPSACAVEALLGVAFDTRGLVDLVLGGAPVIESPFEVLEQKWERDGGYERLVIANERLVQELRFGWVGNDWRVVGGQLWQRAGKERGPRLWTVEHLELVPQGGAYLPTKTKVSTPTKRRDDTVVIHYKERDPDPAFAKRAGGDGGDDGGDSGDPWEGEDSGDPWEDDEGWEDDATTPDEAATDEAATDEAATDETTTDGAPPKATPPKATTPKAPPPLKGKPAPKAIPPEFQLEPAGLAVRGDLCR